MKVGKKTKAKESAVETMENEDHPHSLEDQTGNSTDASILLNQIEISQEEDGTVQVSAPEEPGTQVIVNGEPLVLLTNARQPVEVQTPSVSSSGQELVEIIATTTNDQGTHLSKAKALRPRARLNLPASFSSYFTTRSSG